MRAWRGYISFCRFARRRSDREGGRGGKGIGMEWNGMEGVRSSIIGTDWNRVK